MTRIFLYWIIVLITGSFIYLIDKVFDFFKKDKKQDSIEDVIKKEDTK
uniref:Hypothetical n-terminal truncated transmembrane protein n=1 Tax=Spiroplasma citri TaxID=2133 RepID=Q14KI3_SPICI|nr:hypothetical n-terminal truncated transmembrane protein [Spiroplasma citri]